VEQLFSCSTIIRKENEEEEIEERNKQIQIFSQPVGG